MDRIDQFYDFAENLITKKIWTDYNIPPSTTDISDFPIFDNSTQTETITPDDNTLNITNT